MRKIQTALLLSLVALTQGAWAQTDAARALLNQGQAQQAADLYGQRIESEPGDPDHWLGRALARIRLGQWSGAMADLEKAVAILPFYLSMLVALDLRMLRALRLLRIFKLMRVLVPAVHEFRALNQGRSFRQKIHALVWPSDHGGRLHGYFDTFIVIWVIVSVAAVILESVESIEYVLQLEFIVLDTIAVSIFTLEYLMRVYSAVEQPGMRHPIMGRLRFAKSPGALIDLLAILPFFLEVLLHHLVDLRFLRVFRLMRLLKLTRYTGATKTLGKVIA